nr:MAG TPA: hypothetical protein [Caudoviricetes sp.]
MFPAHLFYKLSFFYTSIILIKLYMIFIVKSITCFLV